MATIPTRRNGALLGVHAAVCSVERLTPPTLLESAVINYDVLKDDVAFRKPKATEYSVGFELPKVNAAQE
jgi:hypothetical protein